VDTFAKGLILENPYYLASASPLSAQKEIASYLHANPYTGTKQFDLENRFTGGAQTVGHTGYVLFNLRPADEPNSYYAELIILLGEIRRPDSEWTPGEYRQYVDEETDLSQPGFAYFPIKTFTEDGRWVVEPAGERQIIFLQRDRIDQTYSDFEYAEAIADAAPDAPGVYRGQGRTGEAVIISCQCRTVNNRTEVSQPSWARWPSSSFNTDAMPHASFYEEFSSVREIYTFTGTAEEQAAVTEASFVYKPVYDLSGGTSISQLNYDADGNGRDFEEGSWDGRLTGGSGHGFSGRQEDRTAFQRLLGLPQTRVSMEEPLPQAYSMQIQLNGEVADEFLLLPSVSVGCHRKSWLYWFYPSALRFWNCGRDFLLPQRYEKGSSGPD